MSPGLRISIPSPVMKNACNLLKISMARPSKDFIIIIPNLTVTQDTDSLNLASGQSMSETASKCLPKIQTTPPCIASSYAVPFMHANDQRTPDSVEDYSLLLSKLEILQLRINLYKVRVAQKLYGSVQHGGKNKTTVLGHHLTRSALAL